MRMSKKFLEELILEIADADTLKMVNKIQSKQNVSEFAIADKMRMTVNQVRNMLYKLHNHNLVSFTRKKDRKKGWYIYYWTFNSKRAKEVLVKIKNEKLKQLMKRLKRESEDSFFICPDKCIRMSFENALENEFKCIECGQILVQEDNKGKIDGLKKEIKALEKELGKEKAKF